MKVIDRLEAIHLIHEEVYGKFKHEEGCIKSDHEPSRGCDVSFGYYAQCGSCGVDVFYSDIFDPKRAAVVIKKLDLKPMANGKMGSSAAIFITEDGGFSTLIFSASSAKARGSHDDDMGVSMVNAILDFLFHGKYKVEK